MKSTLRARCGGSKLCIATAIWLTGQIAPTPAIADTILLEAVTPWHSDWQENSCVLRRGFGDKKEPSIMTFERFGPGPFFQLVLISNRLKHVSNDDRVTLTFGDENRQDYSKRFRMGETQSGTPTLFFPATALVPRDVMDPDQPATLPDPARESGITQVTVQSRGRHVIFKTGELGRPFASMRECIDSLVRNWGFDPQALSSLSRSATPLTPIKSWLRSTDYPAGALIGGHQAIVNFVLFVDAQGQPTRCILPRSYSGEDFEKATCSKLMERARFEPALDAQGNPVASFYFNTVSWIMR